MDFNKFKEITDKYIASLTLKDLKKVAENTGTIISIVDDEKLAGLFESEYQILIDINYTNPSATKTEAKVEYNLSAKDLLAA